MDVTHHLDETTGTTLKPKDKDSQGILIFIQLFTRYVHDDYKAYASKKTHGVEIPSHTHSPDSHHPFGFDPVDLARKTQTHAAPHDQAIWLNERVGFGAAHQVCSKNSKTRKECRVHPKDSTHKKPTYNALHIHFSKHFVSY